MGVDDGVAVDDVVVTVGGGVGGRLVRCRCGRRRRSASAALLRVRTLGSLATALALVFSAFPAAHLNVHGGRPTIGGPRGTRAEANWKKGVVVAGTAAVSVVVVAAAAMLQWRTT